MMLRKVTTLSLLPGLFVFAACGKKSQEKALEKQVEEVLEKQSGMKAERDPSGGRNLEIPKDFPKDVHVYKGASVIMAMTQDKNIMVTLESKDDMKKVADTYKKRMTSDDWEEKGAMNMPNAIILRYQKEKRRATVSVSQQDKKTHIQIVLESQK